MTIKVTTIQKENTRYQFVKSVDNDNKERYCIITEQVCKSGLGAYQSYRYVTKNEGNAFYQEMLAKGFKQFRNIHEVTWYATRENNTSYEEVWTTEGKYFVPIKSRVTAETA